MQNQDCLTSVVSTTKPHSLVEGEAKRTISPSKSKIAYTEKTAQNLSRLL